MEQPFAVNSNTTMASLQILFGLLFKGKQDSVMQVFENASDAEILSVLKNKQIGFNVAGNQLVLCMSFNGKLYKFVSQ